MTLSDAFAILRYLSQGGSLRCEDAADVDDDGKIAQVDAFRLLAALFYRQTPPPPPFGQSGPDPTPDGLTCRGGAVPGGTNVAGAGGGAELNGGAGCEDSDGGADIDFLHFRGTLIAGPGHSSVRVPILLTTAGDIEGLTLSFYAPPDAIRLEGIEFDGNYLSASGIEPDWTCTFGGLSQDGYLAGTIALSLGRSLQTMPAVQDGVLAYLRFSVLPQVPVGSRLAIDFRTTPGNASSLPLPNEISRRGSAQPRRLCGLTIDVVDGTDVFIRGDANRDLAVNIVDAVTILRWLFVDKDQVAPLPCPDAADANDNGRVQVTDAIYLVSYLFGRGAAPVLPFPTPGRDWSTDDSLGCAEQQ